MSDNYRETLIRVGGVENIIRTDLTSTVARMEKDHTAGVREALIAMRTAHLSKTFNDELAATKARAATRMPEHTDHATAKKPHPKPRFTGEVPDYMIKVGPDAYMTPEAAESLGVSRAADEVLPGLDLRAFGAKGWALYILSSATEEKPEGGHMGAVFKTKRRAREVATSELSGVDWTQTPEELTGDPYTSALCRYIHFRELAASGKRFWWATSHADKALAEMAALRPAADAA
ncbi:hypothetical protein [Streptomyces sp. CAU 1734]|uniref:hypothetical protein n=1 Tax=Streptomyces sp. CAU 1734 TaxID=3140360 RepID=UPI00326192FA